MAEGHLGEDELIALALGDVGPGQAPALLHLNACQLCRSAFDDLSQTIDVLVRATPTVAPPAGFDGRVLERLQVRAPGRRRSYRTPMLIAAAMLVGLILGAFGAGTVLDHTTTTASERGAALLTGAGSAVGTVEPSQSDGQQVVVLQVTKGRPGIRYTCRVLLDNGSVRVAGDWPMPASGRATWIVYGSASTIDRVELVTDADEVWATAELG